MCSVRVISIDTFIRFFYRNSKRPYEPMKPTKTKEDRNRDVTFVTSISRTCVQWRIQITCVVHVHVHVHAYYATSRREGATHKQCTTKKQRHARTNLENDTTRVYATVWATVRELAHVPWLMSSTIVPIRELALNCARIDVYEVIVHMRFLACAHRVSTLPIAFVHAMVDGILMSRRYSFHAHDLSSSLTMFVLDLI